MAFSGLLRLIESPSIDKEPVPETFIKPVASVQLLFHALVEVIVPLD